MGVFETPSLRINRSPPSEINLNPSRRLLSTEPTGSGPPAVESLDSGLDELFQSAAIICRESFFVLIGN